MGYPIRSIVDHHQVEELVKINGDLGRLGGLLKLWLSNGKPAPGIDARTIRETLKKIDRDARSDGGADAASPSTTGRAHDEFTHELDRRTEHMIIKHVPMRTLRKSNVVSLVDYLTNTQGRQERVGEITLTNCHSDRHDAASLEMLNTQSLNTRSQSDKTYHLIVSFRPGELPSTETLRAIEARVCHRLGFGSISGSVSAP